MRLKLSKLFFLIASIIVFLETQAIAQATLSHETVIRPEASGLTNNELSYANYVVKLPTNDNFESLNISHCLILFCYEIFKILNKKVKKFSSKYKNKFITKNELNKFVNFLVDSLDHIGFFQPNHKRHSMILNMRTIFHKMDLSDKEIRILLSIFSSLKNNRTK